MSGIRRAGGFIALALLAALVLKVLAGDPWYALKLVFYLPAIIVAPPGLALIWLLRAPLRVRTALAAMLLLFGVLALRIDQPLLLRLKPPPSSPNSASFRVVGYNVMAYNLSEKGVLEAIVSEEPDVVCLIEGTFEGRRPENVAKALGKEYEWAVGSRLSIASRHPILGSEMISSRRGIRLLRASIEIDGRPLLVYAVDVKPPIRRDDAEAFGELWATLQLEESGPAIILGDFNAPRGSGHLTHAMSGWEDSFLDASQARYLASWPSVPFPLWQIDHAYSRGGVRAIGARFGGSKASDHLPIVVDYAWTAE